MNNINILVRNFKQFNLFFPTVLVGLFLVFSPSLNSNPFGDDFVHIFNNFHVYGLSNPLPYWDITSESYKSWPMTYTVVWFLYSIFGQNFIAFRCFNILIHFFNGVLLRKILNQQQLKYSNLFTLIFLFHPIVNESIFWIFQLKTLLSVTFILLSFKSLLNLNKQFVFSKYLVSFSTFLISILFKSTGIFLPFLVLYMFIKAKRNLLLVIPFFLVSLISGIENIKGITVSKSQSIKVEHYEDNYFKDNVIKENLDKDIQVQLKNNNRNTAISFFDESLISLNNYKSYIYNYFKNSFSLKKNFLKLNISINAFSHYFISLTGIPLNYIVYPNLDLNSTSSTLTIILFFILLMLTILFYRKIIDFYFLGIVFLFIPISGYFYVPYMEFSFVADHWFYGSFIFVIFYIANKTKNSHNLKIKYFLGVFTIFLIIKSTFLNFSLSSTKDHLYKNLSAVPQSIILREYLLEIEAREANFKKAINLGDQLLEVSSNKQEVLDRLITLAKNAEKPDLEYKYLILKIKTLLRHGNVVQANNILNLIPKELANKEVEYLKILTNTITNSLAKKDIDKLDSILIK